MNALENTVRLNEAASYFGCHEATLRRKIRRGELPAFKVLGRIRIRREDLERLAAGSRVVCPRVGR